MEDLSASERDAVMKHVESTNFLSHGEQQNAYKYTVRTVDIATWIAESFTKDDFLFIKMDIEGAEYAISEKLHRLGALGLIDVLSLEAHDHGFTKTIRSKNALDNFFKTNAPGMRVIKEGGLHQGYDSHSKPPSADAIHAAAQKCGLIS